MGFHSVVREVHAVVSDQASHTLCGVGLSYKDTDDKTGLKITIFSGPVSLTGDLAEEVKRKGCRIVREEPTCVYCYIIRRLIRIRILDHIMEERLYNIEEEKMEEIETFDMGGYLQVLGDTMLPDIEKRARAALERLDRAYTRKVTRRKTQ